MLALNVIAGISYLLLDDTEADNSVSLAPLDHGGLALVFKCRF